MNHDDSQLPENEKLYLEWKKTYVSPTDELLRKISAGEIIISEEDCIKAAESLAKSTSELFGEDADDVVSRFNK